ncbi:eukaryotic translation initiation factor 3 subunit G-domain-containing protein [Lipomyces tetrasporus]|uniref:Eukaryotic translation initiation factor 3 subunit G n=1 Tax=Lipomyces tetrasporus TaxID=54092 RepID=A0AAD7QQM2_9ASCO|nr:eukaryotic translation initiation factor 3 subunit G-domain-containing protein [Lipomyces tetrasporus]KAJ8099498.1 eukaryotic translation initiation factor 3 subunit G-domain-containing protein [Lipomyces tetrasporus]
MPDLASKPSTTNWADDDDDSGFPAPLVTSNPDGTKTVISYRVNPDTGKKVKVTQKIKTTVVKERVNPSVAERKRWAKFGLERGSRPGPDVKTTSVGENTPLKLIVGWKESKEEKVEISKAEAAKVKAITCRTCGGEHFTSRCPYKDRLPTADVAADSNASTPRTATPEPSAAAAPTTGPAKSAYVPPHLRRTGASGGRGEGEKMTSYRDRDDSATLRVSNIGEDVTEDDLGRLFERFGRIQRLYLAKDRETNRSKGYAFISYYDVNNATRACERMNGRGFENLILRVEFSRKT